MEKLKLCGRNCKYMCRSYRRNGGFCFGKCSFQLFSRTIPEEKCRWKVATWVKKHDNLLTNWHLEQLTKNLSLPMSALVTFENNCWIIFGNEFQHRSKIIQTLVDEKWISCKNFIRIVQKFSSCKIFASKNSSCKILPGNTFCARLCQAIYFLQ